MVLVWCLVSVCIVGLFIVMLVFIRLCILFGFSDFFRLRKLCGLFGMLLCL